MKRGYLVLPAGAEATVLQLAPPLNIPWPLLEGFVQTLRALLEAGDRAADSASADSASADSMSNVANAIPPQTPRISQP